MNELSSLLASRDKLFIITVIDSLTGADYLQNKKLKQSK